jgi:hypothetical protein
MKVEETEKPFIVTKHCYGNSKRKELKAKENTVRWKSRTAAFKEPEVTYSQEKFRRRVLKVKIQSEK